MNYDKGQRLTLITVLVLCQVLLLGGTAATAYKAGEQKAANGGDRSVNLSTFWQAWDLLDGKFYGETNDEKRLEGAISGMVAGLEDPYTVYLPPAEDDLFRADLQGSFGGIGAELEMRNQLLTIVAPLQGTPAEKAGLVAGDVIFKIDDKETATLNVTEAVGYIRGDKGTKVKLTIVRAGKEAPFEVELERDTIVVKSVVAEQIGTDQAIAYIKVNKFGDDTTDLLKAAFQDAATKKGIILDLRNNPGGYLYSAVEAIGMVIPTTITSDNADLRNRVALKERTKDGEEKAERATNRAIVPEVPLVVLINGGSASASEIFAGAMKDYGRAKLVGELSFGKGSVQDLVDLKNGGSIKVTIAHWLTPTGTEINGKGIEPDVKVVLPEDVSPSKDDVQVQEALKLLQ